MISAVFESFGPHRHPAWPATFTHPSAVYEAHHLDEVRAVVEAAEQAARAGRWAVLLLSYEAAPAFDPALETHPPGPFPLAWAAVFAACGASPLDPQSTVLPTSLPAANWTPQIDHDHYDAAIAAIHAAIERGETWQVNYSFPLQARFHGNLRELYRGLTASQQAGFCACLDLGRFQVLSLSPELFFERRGTQLRVRPMKGTCPRGRWLEEDAQRRRQLETSDKDRAENLMIVDLLRNDLGRVALPGTVRTTRLFEVESYETVLQMTSEIEARCPDGTPLHRLLAALFPCGSVTGAPKVRTMHWIRELEPHPRGLYTGAIGWLRPGGDAIFSVAIRTLQRDATSGAMRCGIGGGITWDSTAASEYDECRLKARFLTETRPHFDLLESLLLEDGELRLLHRHLKRMRQSAQYFGFPWPEQEVFHRLRQLRQAHPQGRWKLRLLSGPGGEVRAEVQPLVPEPPDCIRHVALATTPVDPADVFLFHKTTHRSLYQQRRREGFDDTILWNQDGEITESLVANVVVVDEQGRWTPPRACGLLAGTLRQQLLDQGRLRERVIRKEELRQAKSLYLINSVRGWMRACLAPEPAAPDSTCSKTHSAGARNRVKTVQPPSSGEDAAEIC